MIGDKNFTVVTCIAGSVANVLALPAAPLVMEGIGFIATMIFVFLLPKTLRNKQG